MSDDYCDGGGFSSDGFGLALCMGAFNPRPPPPSPDPAVIIHYEDNSHLIATANEHIRSWQRHAENLEAENRKLRAALQEQSTISNKNYRDAEYFSRIYLAYNTLFNAARIGFSEEPEYHALWSFAEEAKHAYKLDKSTPKWDNLFPLLKALDSRIDHYYGVSR
jgi:hypothetical protein